MKKMDGSSLKRLLRISWKAFAHTFGSHFSLSHTFGYLDFSWNTLGECGCFGDLEKERKERKKKEEASKEEHESSDYNKILCKYYLHV